MKLSVAQMDCTFQCLSWIISIIWGWYGIYTTLAAYATLFWCISKLSLLFCETSASLTTPANRNAAYAHDVGSFVIADACALQAKTGLLKTLNWLAWLPTKQPISSHRRLFLTISWMTICIYTSSIHMYVTFTGFCTNHIP